MPNKKHYQENIIIRRYISRYFFKSLIEVTGQEKVVRYYQSGNKIFDAYFPHAHLAIELASSNPGSVDDTNDHLTILRFSYYQVLDNVNIPVAIVQYYIQENNSLSVVG
jgi:hypothetical protein